MVSQNDLHACTDRASTSANSPTVISSNEKASVNLDDSCVKLISFCANEDTSCENMLEESRKYHSHVPTVERSNVSDPESNLDDVKEKCESADNNDDEFLTITSPIESPPSEDCFFDSMEVPIKSSILLDGEEIPHENSANETIEEFFFDAGQFSAECPLPVAEEVSIFEERHARIGSGCEPSIIASNSAIKTVAMYISKAEISSKEKDARRQSDCEPSAMMNNIATKDATLSTTDVKFSCEEMLAKKLVDCKPSSPIFNLDSKAIKIPLFDAYLRSSLEQWFDGYFTSIPLREKSKRNGPRTFTRLFSPHRNITNNERRKKNLKSYYLRDYRILKRLIQENTIIMRFERMLLDSAYIDIFLVKKKTKREKTRKQKPTVRTATTAQTIFDIPCDDRVKADGRLEKHLTVAESASDNVAGDSTLKEHNYSVVSTNLNKLYSQEKFSTLLPSTLLDQQSSTKFGSILIKKTVFGKRRKPSKKKNQISLKKGVTAANFTKKEIAAATYDAIAEGNKKNGCARVATGKCDKAFENENDLEPNEGGNSIKNDPESFTRNDSCLSLIGYENGWAERISAHQKNHGAANYEGDVLDTEFVPFLATTIEDAESNSIKNDNASANLSREIDLGGPALEEEGLNRMQSSIGTILASRARKRKTQICSCLCQMTCVLAVIIGIFALGILLGFMSQYYLDFYEKENEVP